MDTRPYDIIYADPPWPQKKVVRKVRPNQKPELDYHTEPVERCIELCVPFFNKAAPKHNVFMWAIDKFIPDTERLMADLGYKVHARLIWDKTNGIPAARTVRFSHEYLLWFFKRGAPLSASGSDRQIHHGHARKVYSPFSKAAVRLRDARGHVPGRAQNRIVLPYAAAWLGRVGRRGAA